MKTYWFEDGDLPDETTFHSEQYHRSEECKAASKLFCEEHKKDVKLFSSDGYCGHQYGKWFFNNGNVVYKRVHG